MKRKREGELAAEEVEAVSEILSPQGPAFIGPTPQRDGIVLGLFDNLNAETPSKRRIIFGEIEPNVFQTPTKNDTEAASEASSASRTRGERTPLSVSRRNLFNQFLTPKKRKLDEEGTPTSALKGLATPAFLRRENVLGRIEEADETTPRPAPWKRRGMVRSLSAMIKDMRKDEDDRLDEEADIMRELEMEEQGILAPARPRVYQVQVEDSQVVMPLGPDRGLESEEEEEEEELGRNGQPRKVWKKKGLKRQTRRSNSESSGILLLYIYANNCQYDRMPLSSKPHQSFNIMTRTSQCLYQKHRHKQMLSRHYQTMTTIQTMRATSLTQQRNARRQQRKWTTPQRRKRVLLRKSRRKSQLLHMQTIRDSRSRVKVGMEGNLEEDSVEDRNLVQTKTKTMDTLNLSGDKPALTAPRCRSGYC